MFVLLVRMPLYLLLSCSVHACVSVYVRTLCLPRKYISFHMQFSNDLDDMRSQLAVQTRRRKKSEDVSLLHLCNGLGSRQPPPSQSSQTTNIRMYIRNPEPTAITHQHSSWLVCDPLTVCSPLELWSRCWRPLNHRRHLLDRVA